MMFLSGRLLFGTRYRNWERSLRRFNKRPRWNLCRWLTQGTYENMKFRKGWKTATFVNPPKQVLPTDNKPVQYCDMEKLHRQDTAYRSTRVSY